MDRRRRDELLSRLRHDARLIAERFGLQYRDILAEHPRVKTRYGVCYEDGLIKVRLNHARTGEPLKYSSLIDTLCHELAHLRHFNHGPEFKELFFRMLGWARRQGIYRPGPQHSGRRSAAPRPAPSRIPRRNGVPVFPDADEGPVLALPWIAPPPDDPEATPSSSPAATPPPAGRPQRPQQLSLF